jgi:hypothetical protein
MAWKEGLGIVTASFEMWKMADREQRVFLTRTAELIDSANEVVWDQLEQTAAPMTADGIFLRPEPIDIFYAEIGGLMPEDHHWYLCASVLKDAVTTFEVYLESAMTEVWTRTRQDVRWKDKGPFWPDLEKTWKQTFGLDVETDEVADIRRLRNLLTHRRGEPRSQTERERFGLEEYERVSLSEDRVLAAMEAIGDQVRRLDPSPHAAAWGPDEGAGADCG